MKALNYAIVALNADALFNYQNIQNKCKNFSIFFYLDFTESLFGKTKMQLKFIKSNNVRTYSLSHTYFHLRNNGLSSGGMHD